MGKTLKLIENDKKIKFILVGFNDQEGYGEVFVTKDNITTFIFRGTGKKNVMKEAKYKINKY
jgi:hypothetical protein